MSKLRKLFYCLLLIAVLWLPAVAHGQETDAGLLWVFEGQGRVNTVSMANNAETIAVGGRDNIVRVFDHQGNLQWSFAANNSILDLAMTSDGRWLAVASEDRQVYFLDATGALRWQAKAGRAVNQVALSDDASLIAATADDLFIYAFDQDGRLLWQQPTGAVTGALAVYGKGENTRIVTGSEDGLLTIYSRAGSMLLQVQMDYGVAALDVTPNGARILVGLINSTVGMLNGSNGELLWLSETTSAVQDVALANGGATVLIGAADGAIDLRNGEDGRSAQQWRELSAVLGVALSADGQLVAVATTDGVVQLYDREAARSAQARSEEQRRMGWLGSAIGFLGITLGGVWVLRSTNRGRKVWHVRSTMARSMITEIWRARVSYALILPTVLLLLIFNYYPAASALYHAFTDWNPGLNSEWVGLANFQYLLNNRFFWASFQNLGILIVIALVRTLTVPLFVAVLLFNLRNRFAQYWMRTLFVLPIVVPMVVEILIWNNIYDPSIGLLNQTLEALGLSSWTRVWYGDANVALAAIVFVGFPWVSPFALLIFYAGLISIPDEILDASKVDGANAWRRFWRIELPLLRGQIKLLMVLTFINVVQTFQLVFLTTGGGPGSATYTPALELYFQAMRMGRFGVASAIGIVLFLIILIGTIINMRITKSSLEYEA